MTVLHLVRAPIETNALSRWADERGWVRRRGRAIAFDEGRALHHLLNEALGPGKLRPFRFLVPPRRAKGNLYGYSTLDAEALRVAVMSHALPEHLNVLLPERLESKPMPNGWRAGQRLGFDIRIRPVRRLRNDLDMPSSNRIGAGAEMDVFLLEALHRHPETRDGMARQNRTRQTVYLDWLAERFGSVASLDRQASRLVRFRRVRVARHDSTGPEGPDATVQGNLTVTDPAAFVGLLARGVGRHRAYGYGMLLLRPPRRLAPER